MPLTPNMFVLGAGKCGTTFLWNGLKQHPEIHGSKIKEPTFFCSEFQVVKDPIAYFKLFESSKPVRFEASHAYLSNPDTPPVIRELFPDARFIVTLRDPTKRAYSLYRHMRNHVSADRMPQEPISTFEEALEAEDARVADPEFRRKNRQYYWNFLYCQSSLYDVQLERYFALFDRKRFFITTLAKIECDAPALVRKMFSFLDVDPDFLPRLQSGHTQKRRSPAPPLSQRAERIMAQKFCGLKARVDDLINEQLDWSK